MADPTVVAAALRMDRADAIGNSTDTFGRQSLHVKIGNSALEPLPVTATFSAYKGVLDLLSGSSISTPGVQQTLISFTNPALEHRDVWRLIVTCRQPATFELIVNSVTIGKVRTGPANLTSEFFLTPFLTTVATDTIEVKVTALSDTPAADIDAYVMTDKY